MISQEFIKTFTKEDLKRLIYSTDEFNEVIRDLIICSIVYQNPELKHIKTNYFRTFSVDTPLPLKKGSISVYSEDGKFIRNEYGYYLDEYPPNRNDDYCFSHILKKHFVYVSLDLLFEVPIRYVFDSSGELVIQKTTDDKRFKCNELFRLREKILKTKKKLQIRIFNGNMKFPEAFLKNIESIKDSANHQCEKCLDLKIKTRQFRTLLFFQCRICNRSFMCSCFKNEGIYSLDDMRKYGFEIKDSICHLCRRQFPHKQYTEYGSRIRQYFDPYISFFEAASPDKNWSEEYRQSVIGSTLEDISKHLDISSIFDLRGKKREPFKQIIDSIGKERIHKLYDEMYKSGLYSGSFIKKLKDFLNPRNYYYNNFVLQDAKKRLQVHFMRMKSNAAENIIREKLNISKIGEQWTTETQLYYIIKELFKGYRVIHHARPKFLNGQEYDIYIPKLRLAIEYQGKQHFYPIPFFGGTESFAKNRERDDKKRKLSKLNGVKLIYFKYTEPINYDYIVSKLVISGMTISG